jgi:hypothetical protein
MKATQVRAVAQMKETLLKARERLSIEEKAMLIEVLIYIAANYFPRLIIEHNSKRQ